MARGGRADRGHRRRGRRSPARRRGDRRAGRRAGRAAPALRRPVGVPARGPRRVLRPGAPRRGPGRTAGTPAARRPVRAVRLRQVLDPARGPAAAPSGRAGAAYRPRAHSGAEPLGRVRDPPRPGRPLHPGAAVARADGRAVRPAPDRTPHHRRARRRHGDRPGDRSVRGGLRTVCLARAAYRLHRRAAHRRPGAGQPLPGGTGRPLRLLRALRRACRAGRGVTRRPGLRGADERRRAAQRHHAAGPACRAQRRRGPARHADDVRAGRRGSAAPALALPAGDLAPKTRQRADPGRVPGGRRHRRGARAERGARVRLLRRRAARESPAGLPAPLRSRGEPRRRTRRPGLPRRLPGGHGDRAGTRRRRTADHPRSRPGGPRPPGARPLLAPARHLARREPRRTATAP